MKTYIAFLKQETVLVIAWLLAAVTAVLVPPDTAYWNYIDFHTLGLLFSLMAVMAGLQGLGVFRDLGAALLRRTHTTRQLELSLVFLPFFSSMLVTNDVALITFVPFAMEALALARQSERLIPVAVLQTVAANLGSMATPIGNPQNLYLYGRYELSLLDFFQTTLPLTALSALLLLVCLLLRPSVPLSQLCLEGAPFLQRGKLTAYLVLFVLCLSAVAKALPVWLLVLLTALAVWLIDRSVLAQVDWSLLATFIGFFLFVGNLGRLPALRQLLQSLLSGREVLCSVLSSQVLSNVPSALLLSGFTDNGTGLLVGTNLGGLGTLIASMASLISYKQITRYYPGQKGRYLLRFTLVNLAFLLLLLLFSFFIHH